MADTSDTTPEQDAWQRWNDELELSRKARGYDQWQTRSKKIIKRYRDERSDVSADTTDLAEGARFNILWSNVQTLMPALFAKSPKPVVERRYLDKDDVGRTASVILERTLSYELDDGNYAAALKKVVLDRLLPGRGVAWVRYEPKFTPMPGKTQDVPEPEMQEATSDAPQEEVAAESVVVDYIDWRDFSTSVARTWEEVWWVSKRVYMTRKELVARFGKKGKNVPLDWKPSETETSTPGIDSEGAQTARRATVYEIWDKRDRKVLWMAKEFKDELLDERDDPLHLECFWPVPKPLYATLTNDSLVPIPDYTEYQDQAAELDDLTTRISNLTKAIKVAGVYDASAVELKRMFEEGFENELVPCDNMAEFSTKAGSNGMGHIWLLPIKDMASTLLTLYDARERVKQSLYEITGISDIVRGQASAGAKTATEQRIKGQFASMRLNDMQSEVARFARDTLRIMGEIIAEHFDPMTLFEVSGFEQYAKEQWPPEPAAAPPPAAMPPQMGHNGGPPMAQPTPGPAMGGPPTAGPPPAAGSPGMAAPAGAPPGLMPPPGMGMMAPPPSPEQMAMGKAAAMFKQAIALLRNDKLRGFRIEIETDSIVEPDQAETQKARTELMGAISQFLPQAIQAGMQAPELKPLLARLLMFFLRGFKASRDIEAAFEQFIDDQTKEAAKPKPPPPPTPDQIKAQMMQEQQQAENQRMQAQAVMDQQTFQMEQQGKQADMALEQQKMQFEMQMEEKRFQMEMQQKEMELSFKERELALNARAQEHSAAIKGQAEVQSAAIQADGMDRQAEADERKHELGVEVMEAKAKQAKKPPSNGAAK